MSRDFPFIQALRRQPVARRPVWLMRQAGRYLPEYRATREQAGSFLGLLKNPELACEVTMQPLRRFDLDAAIVFADILTIPDAMGLGLSFVAGEGPRFEAPVESLSQARALPIPDPERDLGYVMETLRHTSRELAGGTPLIGFSGGPWTLAAYMLEGQSTGGQFRRARAAVHARQDVVDAVIQRLVPAIVAYLAAQAHAGADALMLFESWAGLLPPDGFKRYVLAPLRELVAALRSDHAVGALPLIVFARGAAQHAPALAETGADALGIDWTASLGAVREVTGGRVALQGNLDPAALYAPERDLRRAVRTVIDDFGSGVGHVFNLGHGIAPDVDPDRVAALIDEVHRVPV